MEDHAFERNQILHALPPEERARLFPHLQRVSLPLGTVIYDPARDCDTSTFQ